MSPATHPAENFWNHNKAVVMEKNPKTGRMAHDLSEFIASRIFLYCFVYVSFGTGVLSLAQDPLDPAELVSSLPF